jgi:hypothetical protein
MEELIEQIPQADWVDQDLLTKELASSLLDREIDAERERLRRFDHGERGGDLIMSRADMERRLNAMITIRDRTRGAA